MKRILTLLIITLALFAFGCSPKDAQTKNEGYQVTDSRNVTLHFKQKPQRIISLFPSTDEVLLSLVDHSRILALSKWSRDLNFSNVAEEAKKKRAEATARFFEQLRQEAEKIVATW